MLENPEVGERCAQELAQVIWFGKHFENLKEITGKENETKEISVTFSGHWTGGAQPKADFDFFGAKLTLNGEESTYNIAVFHKFSDVPNKLFKFSKNPTPENGVKFCIMVMEREVHPTVGVSVSEESGEISLTLPNSEGRSNLSLFVMECEEDIRELVNWVRTGGK